MRNCKHEQHVMRWFDGEATPGFDAEAHVATCATCEAQYAAMDMLRTGIAACVTRAEIADPQFPAFMDPIREQVRGADRGQRVRPFWTWLSVTAAAMVIALASSLLLFSGPGEVAATSIEAVDTDLVGATTSVDYTGAQDTIWINIEHDDVW